ncbi:MULTISPECIES: hypothetical protein [Lysobacter]|uniref:hypothetical protein n=1 Tax=Lysobacter TaxID=68 RepID=UPI001F283357|nr:MULTISPECIES: hypothetical protein [Lysobacter]UJB18810.1 hypothetical protein L1A79_21225 [Lysobacter capsici]UJQ27465.1 hypothetical protein L2D09_18660 [Lysobacter gummosus]
MAMRERTPFANLPIEIKAIIEIGDFIKAYALPDSGNYIFWTRNRSLGKQRENEFSVELGRSLERAEREKMLPASQKLGFMVRGFSIVKGFRLEEGTDCLYETYAIFDPESHQTVLECEQIVFVPTMRAIVDVVDDALDKLMFPQEYAGWSEDEKVMHWTQFLYRARRQAGETGSDPNVVFDTALLEYMSSIDSNIRSIIHQVLDRLAGMKVVSAADLNVALEKGWR